MPVPACSCSVCLSGTPKNTRLRTSALYRADNGANILIDAGPDLRQQVLRHRIDKIDAIVFTHHHGDHLLGIDDLRGFYLSSRKPIPCYATAHVQGEIKATFRYLFNPDPEYKGGTLTQIEFNPITTPLTPLSIAGVKVEPFELNHGGTYVLGFKFGDIAYATDCNNVPTTSKALLKGIEHLVLDGLRNESHASHFTIPEACQQAKELGAKNTYLIHMSHSVDFDSTKKNLPDGVSLCFDGLEIFGK